MGYEARCKPVDRRECSKSGLISHSRVAAIWSYPIELTRHHFQSASQADDAVLGANIGSDPFAANLAEDGRDVDDRAAASLHHGPDLRANTKENAGQIDVDDLLPLADRKVRGEGGVASDACIVAGHVQPAERLRGGGDERGMIFGAPSIGVPIK